MVLTEDQIVEKNATKCRHRLRITLLPFQYEFTYFSCGYNVIKRKHEFTKIQRKT